MALEKDIDNPNWNTNKSRNTATMDMDHEHRYRRVMSAGTLAGDHVRPNFLRVVTNSTDQAEARNHDATRQTYLPPFEFLLM